jgi:hypothetical protein
MAQTQTKIKKSKIVDSDGQIREGQLLTETEAAVFGDPMFETVTMNTRVKGAYISTASMRSILGYILTRYTMTLRDNSHEVASSRDDQNDQSLQAWAEQDAQAESQETWIEDTK